MMRVNRGQRGEKVRYEIGTLINSKGPVRVSDFGETENLQQGIQIL